MQRALELFSDTGPCPKSRRILPCSNGAAEHVVLRQSDFGFACVTRYLAKTAITRIRKRRTA